MGRDSTVHDVAVVRLYLWFDDFHIDDFTQQTDDFPHQTVGDSTDVLEFIPSDLPDEARRSDGAGFQALYGVPVRRSCFVIAIWHVQ